MKKILMGFFVTVFLVYSSLLSTPLTETEKTTIKNEVKTAFHAMVDACNKIDLNSALQLYWNSPSFLGISSDGIIFDYQQFKKANEDYFAAVASQNFITIKEYISFLGDDLIVYAWQGSNEAMLKTGEKMTFSNFGATSLLKKIEGLWKVIYYHESAMPPVITTSK